MTRQARRMEGVPFSGIRKMMARAWELEGEGKPVIHLEIGRPDFDTPGHIKAAAQKALDEGKVHYTSNYGVPEITRAIAAKLRSDNGLDFDENGEIAVTIGANEAVFMAVMAFIDKGDEVLVPDPSWLNYFHCVTLGGGVPVSVPLRAENDFRMDADDVARLVTPRTRMMVVMSPHNPTGAVLDRGRLEALAALAREHDLLVLSDEIYEKLLYDGAEHHSIGILPGMRERTLVVNGFSKSYSMTGWRLGYIAAPRNLMDVLIRVHQYTVLCATSFGQYGAAAAYEGPQDCVEEMRLEFARRRELILRRLRAMKGIECAVPEGAFYAFPDIGALGRSSEDVAMHLLEDAYVATVPGSAFGRYGEGYIRLAYSNSYENIEEAMDRMEASLTKL